MKSLLSTSLFSSLILSTSVLGVGIGIEYQSAKLSARGNTAVAHIESPSAIHYNPAALSFQPQASAELNLISFHAEGTWNDGVQSHETRDNLKFSGSLFASTPIKSAIPGLAIGIGLTRPYGQAVSWPSSHAARNAGYEAEMDYRQLHLAIAAKPHKTLSLGASFNFAQSDLESEAGLALPTDTFLFEGDDNGIFNAHLGLLYRPVDHLRVGLSYRTSFHLDHEGSFTYTSNNPLVPNQQFDGNVRFDAPSHFIMGVEYDVDERLTLAAQSQWTEWSVVDNFTYTTPTGTQRIPAAWNDGWLHSIGASYQLKDDLELHCGYMFADSIIDNDKQSLLHSDFEQHFLSIGFSQSLASWQIDAAAVYVISEDETINGSLFGTDGKHSADGYFFNLGLTKSL